ncbi:NAD(P)-binding protein [Hypoxylon trugodes]|uniref:NAD(P)-binding protein n=1 Tax=Hypoxylon trugodes TaxID=326681 RepID=UPI00218CA19E|nr:NAD(P)-binding protein [Hypoxylon trugodes]KAI1385808.1 NAD(P)-binding protein [Hypoxylon trugodes]
MSKPLISNPTIPLDSLILVTGANGLIASTIADQLLFAGYRVRGTVRNRAKNAWLASVLTARHGSDRFELVEIPDLTVTGVWTPVVKGVAGIAHVLGALDGAAKDSDKAIEAELPWHIALLEAATSEPNMKSFALTSSAWAAWTPDASVKSVLTKWTWNDSAVQLARSDATPQQKGFAPWMAQKTLYEQKLWEWVRKNQDRIPFTFNSILLDTVIGHCLHPKEQGIPSSTGMVGWAYEKSHLDFLGGMQPQWYIDTIDTALLYVAALTTPGVNGERLYGFGARYSWPKVTEILKNLYPEKDITIMEYNGWDQTKIPNQRAEELLRGVKGAGWTSLEESVQAAAKCLGI